MSTFTYRYIDIFVTIYRHFRTVISKFLYRYVDNFSMQLTKTQMSIHTRAAYQVVFSSITYNLTFHIDLSWVQGKFEFFLLFTGRNFDVKRRQYANFTKGASGSSRVPVWPVRPVYDVVNLGYVPVIHESNGIIYTHSSQPQANPL